METEDFDQNEAERKELNLLTEKGMSFTVDKHYTGFFSKKKTREFIIKSPQVGVMDRLSAEYLELDMDQELINKNNLESLQEAKRVVGRHSKRVARIVAIAVLRKRIRVFPFLIPILASYFYWRMDPGKLFQIAIIIHKMTDYMSFTASIGYLSSQRTTMPQPIENQDDSED